MAVQTIAELYDLYGVQLYRYAVLILADRTAAEDAVQDTFLQIAHALRRKPGESVTFGYLATTVRNTCYTALRQRRRRGEPEQRLIEQVSPEASEEERLVIDEALRSLPPEQREVIYLKVFEGLTFQEIADRCGVSINTAGSRYRYATHALRGVLGRRNQAC